MLYSYLKITANSLERVNLSPLLLGNTAARIKVKSPTGKKKGKEEAVTFTSTNIPHHNYWGQHKEITHLPFKLIVLLFQTTIAVFT